MQNSSCTHHAVAVAQRPVLPLRPPQQKSWSVRFAALVRWLHIYLSLVGFTALLFFAITGITLNHPNWFGGDTPRIQNLNGSLNQDWLHRKLSDWQTQPTPQEESIDLNWQVDQLAIVEYLRASHGFRGAVSEFRTDENECIILFKGPAYSVDVVVNRESGAYSATVTTMGTLALINDLHKGRDSGWVWSIVIDATAALMVLISITGFVLIFYLRRKRQSGIWTAVAGTVLLIVIYWVWVP